MEVLGNNNKKKKPKQCDAEIEKELSRGMAGEGCPSSIGALGATLDQRSECYQRSLRPSGTWCSVLYDQET